ncbi:putative permease [Escherichia coli]|nr:putative permease [Escherichia coli]
MLGFVSGLVAAIGAETALAVLQAKVFDFPWEPDWRLWIVLPCSGALLLSLFGGWLGARLVKGKALFRQFAGVMRVNRGVLVEWNALFKLILQYVSLMMLLNW